MQKAETGALDAKKELEKPKIAKLIEIAVDENQMVYVNWPTDKKELCLTCLAEAIKLIGTYVPRIEVPSKPSILDFVRGRKHA